jgi:hypothetical protein
LFFEILAEKRKKEKNGKIEKNNYHRERNRQHNLDLINQIRIDFPTKKKKINK